MKNIKLKDIAGLFDAQFITLYNKECEHVKTFEIGEFMDFIKSSVNTDVKTNLLTSKVLNIVGSGSCYGNNEVGVVLDFIDLNS